MKAEVKEILINFLPGKGVGLSEKELEEALFLTDYLESLTVIQGKKGTGKTLAAVALAYQLKKYFGRRVLADFHFLSEFGEYGYLNEKRFMEELQKISDIAKHTPEEDMNLAIEWGLKKLNLDLNKAILILDEAYRYFDCRTPSDKLVRVFGYFVAQMRHYGLTLILLCPSKRYLDFRVQGQIDYTMNVAYNSIAQYVVTRSLGHSSGKIKPMKIFAPNYFKMYDSWTPIIMRDKTLSVT